MNLINLLAVTFLISAALLTIQLFQIIREQKRPKSQRIGRQISHKSNKRSKRVANSGLRRRLLSLLNGDASAAQRLVNHVASQYPHQPVDWCVEKAIHDLERDRH